MRLSIIIPAYNEEKTITTTLRDIDKHLSKQGYDYEIVVVNDGSKDRTSEVINKLKPEMKNLRLIDNKKNQGKAGVTRQGLMESKGDYRLFMDADNATTVNHVDKMWPLFEQGYDIVIGSRDSKDAEGAKQAVPQSFLKRMMGNAGNLVIQIVAVRGIWDTQCGFKAFKKEVVEDIMPRMKITGWGFDIEILAVARKLGYKIGIIPVYWINNPESRVNLKGYLMTFVEVFKVRINLIKGVYGKKA